MYKIAYDCAEQTANTCEQIFSDIYDASEALKKEGYVEQEPVYEDFDKGLPLAINCRFTTGVIGSTSGAYIVKI